MKPRHSSLALLIALAIALFVTYFLFIPGIVRLYKSELEVEQQKLRDVVQKIELHQKELDRVSQEIIELRNTGNENNRILREIHTRVVKPADGTPNSGAYRP